MRGKIDLLESRIKNLNDLLNSTIRYGERDIGRLIEYKIKELEKEVRILKNRNNLL